MRLEKYLIERCRNNVMEIDDIDEDDILEVTIKIQKECSKFLKDMSRNKFFLYRGVKNKLGLYVKKTPRQDRRPKDTSPDWHTWANQILQKNFGWKPRSEGVFVTGDNNVAADYGYVYIFFPTGNYKFVWSPKIRDFIDLTLRKNIKDKDTLELMDTYTDKNINKARASYHEIMVKCNSYYLVDYRAEKILKDFLWI